MAMDTIPIALDMAFRTALLPAGNTKTAEAAAMDGIGACEDLSRPPHRSRRSTIRRRTKSAQAPDALERDSMTPTRLRDVPRT
jgi:hypothetical protein